MRITAIRDIVAPIKSDIANAWIDFSTMTASVVAVVTDRVVDGRPVVGFGFNSNGRYAPQGSCASASSRACWPPARTISRARTG